MPLPVRNNISSLPNNRSLAEARLRGRLMKDKRFKEDYGLYMNELSKQGYAEEVPVMKERAAETQSVVWYIQHHGIYKKEKLCIVFECTADFKCHSLKVQLMLHLLNSLIGILCRFRKERVALTCDIQQMLHQVIVEPKDQDLLRFLWWKSSAFSVPSQEYRMTVHLFGATSSPAYANYALKMTEAASEFMKTNIYVEDGLTSVP